MKLQEKYAAAFKFAPLIPLILLIMFPFITDRLYYVHLLWSTFLFIILAQSWNICGGFAGLPSLGHVGFFGIGAYTTAILIVYGVTAANLLTIYLGAIIGGLIAFGVGVAVGFICTPLRGIGFAIGTMTISLIFQFLILFFEGVTYGSLGIVLPRPPTFSKTYAYFAMLGLMLLTNLVAHLVAKSKIGLALRAIRDDEDAAEMTGVNTFAYRALSFGISAIFPAIAGGFYVLETLYIDPYFAFDFGLSLQMIVLTLVGGIGTLWGPIIGASILVPLSNILSTAYPVFHATLYGVLLIVIVLFMPHGILGFINKFVKQKARKS